MPTAWGKKEVPAGEGKKCLLGREKNAYCLGKERSAYWGRTEVPTGEGKKCLPGKERSAYWGRKEVPTGEGKKVRLKMDGELGMMFEVCVNTK